MRHVHIPQHVGKWLQSPVKYCGNCYRRCCPLRERNGFGQCQWFSRRVIFDAMWTEAMIMRMEAF